MAQRRVRSLDAILEQVRGEREAQLRHFDALDSKAGIILGFAGALVALAPVGSFLVDAGRCLATVAGIVALATFWPRRFWAVNLRSLRDLYLTAEPDFTRLRVLDTQVAMAEHLSILLRAKASRLKISMASLALAALLTAIGLSVD